MEVEHPLVCKGKMLFQGTTFHFEKCGSRQSVLPFEELVSYFEASKTDPWSLSSSVSRLVAGH